MNFPATNDQLRPSPPARRTKVKTGCKTCRLVISRMTGSRPGKTQLAAVPKCVKAGHTWDGLESPFRFHNGQPITMPHAGGMKPNPALQPARPASNLRVSGDGLAPVKQQTPSHHYGPPVIRHGVAECSVQSVVAELSRAEVGTVCCQIFISIEEVQKKYAAMAQHIVRGIKIMRKHAFHDRLALLDVFIIKVSSAPCKFADIPSAADKSGTALSLVSIAASTLKFLDNLTEIDTAALLDCLGSWPLILELIVLLGALDPSLDLYGELLIESDRLQTVAEDVSERARTYITCSGTGATNWHDK
ncbi:hypothetical protein LZ32DRAFT_640439 [Colletotrichum eremochloae]|nr:hypothetical protein LZ32DRAFT_640439 [Colletotrichum eremochloae]